MYPSNQNTFGKNRQSGTLAKCFCLRQRLLDDGKPIALLGGSNRYCWSIDRQALRTLQQGLHLSQIAQACPALLGISGNFQPERAFFIGLDRRFKGLLNLVRRGCSTICHAH
jgi:hypothetical protein